MATHKQDVAMATHKQDPAVATHKQDAAVATREWPPSRVAHWTAADPMV